MIYLYEEHLFAEVDGKDGRSKPVNVLGRVSRSSREVKEIDSEQYFNKACVLRETTEASVLIHRYREIDQCQHAM